MIVKIINLFKKIYFKIPLKNELKHFVKVGSSSILNNGLNVRFDLIPEKRIYVDIGERCIINADFIFESSQGSIKIGDNVHIGQANFICRTSIIVEEDVTMAWGITIYDHNSHSIVWEERKNDNNQCFEDFKQSGNSVLNKDWRNVNTASIKICKKVWIGFDVTILKGVTIGEGAVIGAKSVVTKDVPAWTVAAGNPAKFIKNIQRPNSI